MIPYLTGGERPTADRMNLLVDAMEAKLSAILNNCSPALAQKNVGDVLSDRLVGKCFFFCPGNVGTPMMAAFPNFTPVANWGDVPVPGEELFGKPYNHAMHTAALAAHAGNPSNITGVDHAKKIIQLKNMGEVIGYPWGWGLWNSLEAHTLNAGPTTNNEDYFVQLAAQDSPLVLYPSEKRYDYAVAEIIVDGGENSWTLDPSWTKYSCFRIHNLNIDAALSVTAGNLSFAIPPLQCRTIRRDPRVDMEEFTLDGKYLWRFRPNDPRFFWTHNTMGGQPHDSEVANNLKNPNIIFDWINHFDDATKLAFWSEDKHEQVAVNAEHASLFGDPSNNATLIGDLIHHRGDLILVKTLNQPAPPPPDGVLVPYTAYKEEHTRFTFNGYATIVADFAAVGLVVELDGNGDLQVRYPGVDCIHVDLVSVSTNLLKRGPDVPAVVKNIQTTPYPLEHVVFEGGISGGRPTLSDSAPQAIFKLNTSTVTNTTQWFDQRLGWNSFAYFNPDPSGNSASYSDSRLSALARTSAPVALHGIHTKTVAELKKLLHYGDPVLGDDQNGQTALQFYSVVDLVLTPSGLVLRYTESVLPNTPRWYESSPYIQPDLSLTYEGTVNPSPWKLRRWVELVNGVWVPSGIDAAGGYITRNRAVTFRGHGWCEGSVGGFNRTGVRLPGRAIMQAGLYQDTMAGVDGKDMEWRHLPGSGAATGVKLLTLIDERVYYPSAVHRCEMGYVNYPDTRVISPVHGRLLRAQEWLAKSQAEPWFNHWRVSGRSSAEVVAESWLFYPPRGQALALCAEHYNAIAREINARKTGKPLGVEAVRWFAPVAKVVVSLSRADPLTGRELPGFPVPKEWYHGAWDDPDPAYGAAMEELYGFLGVTIRTIADFPTVWNTEKLVANTRQPLKCKAHMARTATVTAVLGGGAYEATLDVEVELIGFENDGIPVASSVNGAAIGPTDNAGEYGTFVLSNYNSTRWVKTADVLSALAGFGLSLTFREVHRPLSLARLTIHDGTPFGPAYHFRDKYSFSESPLTLNAPGTSWTVGHVEDSSNDFFSAGSIPEKELAFYDDATGDFKISATHLWHKTNRSDGEPTLRALVGVAKTDPPFQGSAGGEYFHVSGDHKVMRGEVVYGGDPVIYDDDQHNCRGVYVANESIDLDRWTQTVLQEKANVRVVQSAGASTTLTLIPQPFDHWDLVGGVAAWKETLDTAYKRYPNPAGGPAFSGGIGLGHGGTAPTVRTGGTLQNITLTGDGIISPALHNNYVLVLNESNLVTLP